MKKNKLLNDPRFIESMDRLMILYLVFLPSEPILKQINSKKSTDEY